MERLAKRAQNIHLEKLITLFSQEPQLGHTLSIARDLIRAVEVWLLDCGEGAEEEGDR